MHILVTGGTGYIGSHTCVELLNAGHEVTVIDNLSNSKKEVINRIENITGKVFRFYEADLLDKIALDDVFAKNKIDAVVHFAGFKAVGESVLKPLMYYQNNLGSLMNLCECMSRYNVKKLVLSSSATVYGGNNTSPFTENLPLSATSPYGATKLMIEQILNDLYISDPTWSISKLRYFNPIGAHISGQIGEDPSGLPNNLMPFITQVAVGKREFLNIYGEDYDTDDGTGVRDYIHVTDLAAGHVKALEKIMGTNECEAYNLGTGVGYSVLDVVKSFEKVNDIKIPYKLVERRPGDIATCYSDPSKAEKELNWKAVKTLEDMCRDSWRWQTNNPEGY